jgi:uncharacterized Tic20 family protein
MEYDEKQSRMWGMLCHLSALAGLVIPFGNVLGPLVVWLTKKNEFSFVDDQGKESLNFQISLSIYMAVAAVLSLLLIGIPLLIALGIGGLVLTVIGAVNANDGKTYRYPMTIRFFQ